jgi:hypothetical protein
VPTPVSSLAPAPPPTSPPLPAAGMPLAPGTSGDACHAQAGFCSACSRRTMHRRLLRRTLVLASVLLNVSLLCAWLGTAVVERDRARRGHATETARQVQAALDPVSPIPDR